jgi:hypothetical protein
MIHGPYIKEYLLYTFSIVVLGRFTIFKINLNVNTINIISNHS